jgi:hypothetical protein
MVAEWLDVALGVFLVIASATMLMLGVALWIIVRDSR